jgi:anti-sigma regulatory factor (Ser/Thr protein kinase)
MATAQALICLNDSTQAGEARRNAARIAQLTVLNETEQGKVAIIATELANNLLRHATGGEIIITKVTDNGREGIELLAIDRGPGMVDVGKCLQDGYSTGGTSGTGLGAVRRLSSEFDFFSTRPGGTVFVARVLNGSADDSPRVRWSAICQPAPGETLCGDNWSGARRGDLVSIMVADGLGHGALAAKASDEAVRIFNSDPFRSPGALLEAAHSPLRTTRGAAMAIAQLNLGSSTLKYVGVGNIAGSLIEKGESRGLFSHNGTVGLQIRKIQEFDYPWNEKTLLIMHSDGLQSRWTLADYPGLSQRHPSVIAGVLYRDFKRGRDDVTVVVVR